MPIQHPPRKPPLPIPHPLQPAQIPIHKIPIVTNLLQKQRSHQNPGKLYKIFIVGTITYTTILSIFVYLDDHTQLTIVIIGERSVLSG